MHTHIAEHTCSAAACMVCRVFARSATATSGSSLLSARSALGCPRMAACNAAMSGSEAVTWRHLHQKNKAQNST